jgi:glycosyltransferase involved in cell wall biosynthesis
LEPCDFIHAMPGQALHTFRAARKRGIRTVLNHATGPVRDWVRIMQPEYDRIGLKLTDVCPYDTAYFAREDEEYALADFHCAASTVVRDQLISGGIPSEKIVVIPYGADTGPRVFTRAENDALPAQFRILFAGQIGIRKGLRTLLEALTIAGKPEWRIDFVGAKLPESARDLADYKGPVPLEFHGAKSQADLAAMMRASSVLVLPSLEEGFGLVVPQALNCGCPCIVSDRVGGKDLIRPGENGSIFPTGDAPALAKELTAFSQNPIRTTDNLGWEAPARKLVEWSRSVR